MRQADLDNLLEVMLESHDGISDLLFSVGRPLQVEAFGELKPVDGNLGISALTPYQIENIALNLIGRRRRLIMDFFRRGACDTSYQLGRNIRFRVNIFRQRGNFAIVMRRLEMKVPSIAAMGLPEIFQQVPFEKNGLVLVTGATGSGKTTTLAAILKLVNETQAVHVVTLEDPIEFIHSHIKATLNQRELGVDFNDFPSGVRSALRQAPKIILIGEMRDRETVEIALTAAETGHLVMSTLHTVDAGQTINRIIGMFDNSEEQIIRTRLSDTIRYVISQRLAPKVGGGRVLIPEIMGSNLRIRETIEQGEGENSSFQEIIQDNIQNGWISFDKSVVHAYEDGVITEETALLYSSNRGIVRRELDTIKKVRSGMKGDGSSGLRLDPSTQA